MSKVKLTAVKSFSYNTRALRPGDDFYASPRDALILKGIKKAKDSTGEATGQPSPPPKTGALETLRTQYESLTGSRADARWKEPRLLDEIAKHNADKARKATETPQPKPPANPPPSAPQAPTPPKPTAPAPQAPTPTTASTPARSTANPPETESRVVKTEGKSETAKDSNSKD